MDTTTPTWTTGDRLRKARESASISVTEMAVLLGVTRNTVTNYEHDRTNISASAAATYSEATSAPVGWLLGLEADLRSRCNRESGVPIGVFHDSAQGELFAMAA